VATRRRGTLEGYGGPLIDYLDRKKIHWVAFIYQPPDAEPPMLESDWMILNEFGEFVKKRLQPINKPNLPPWGQVRLLRLTPMSLDSQIDCGKIFS